MAENYITTKSLPIAGGEVLPRGRRVDASHWLNRDILVKSGYIRPLLVEEVQQPAARPIRVKG